MFTFQIFTLLMCLACKFERTSTVHKYVIENGQVRSLHVFYIAVIEILMPIQCFNYKLIMCSILEYKPVKL